MFHGFLDSPKQVYDLAEISESERVGEKGAVLAHLASLGCPVPDGFVITSPPRTIAHDRLGLSDSLKKEIDEHLRGLENKTGRRFFAADADGVVGGKVAGEAGCFPLLLSVRQSTIKSTPVFKTSLNIGFNKAAIDEAIRLTRRPLFVLDSVRRWYQDYGTHVLGIDVSRYVNLAEEFIKKHHVRNVIQLSQSEMQKLVDQYREITPTPEDARRQLYQCVEAILRKHESLGAAAYRSSRGVEDKGVAIVVESMVYGNLTSLSSGVGSVHSRDLTSGERVLSGTYHSRTSGPDVYSQSDEDHPPHAVFGGTEISVFKELRKLQPAVFEELSHHVEVIERSFKAIVRVDFVVENGELYLMYATANVQASPTAQYRLLMELVEARHLTPQHAVCRVSVPSIPGGRDPLWHQNDDAAAMLRWARLGRRPPLGNISCSSVGNIQCMVIARCLPDLIDAKRLGADTNGLLYMRDMIKLTLPDEIGYSQSPALTREERELALHDLRLKLTHELRRGLLMASRGYLEEAVDIGFQRSNSDGTRDEGFVRKDPGKGRDTITSRGVDITTLSGEAPGNQSRDPEHRMDVSEREETSTPRSSGPGTPSMATCDQQSQHIHHPRQQPTLTAVLDDTWDTGTTLSHPEYLTMQAQAVVAACLDCSASLSDHHQLPLSAGKGVGQKEDVDNAHWLVNLCLTAHINEQELAYLIPHVKAGVQKAYEDFDLITVGSIIDDDASGPAASRAASDYGGGLSDPGAEERGPPGVGGPADSPEASPSAELDGCSQRAKHRVTCRMGVLMTTPHVSLHAKRIATLRDVSFVCFDSDSLTKALMGGHLDPNGVCRTSSGKSGACACNAAKFDTPCTCFFGTSGHYVMRENLINEYYHRSILSRDPYYDFADAASSVHWLLKRSVRDVQSAARYGHRKVSILVLGRHSASLDSLRFLHDLQVDAIGCHIDYLPRSLIGCAKVVLEEQSQQHAHRDLTGVPRGGTILQQAGRALGNVWGGLGRGAAAFGDLFEEEEELGSGFLVE